MADRRQEPRTKRGRDFVDIAFGKKPGNVTMTYERMLAEVRRIEDAAVRLFGSHKEEHGG